MKKDTKINNHFSYSKYRLYNFAVNHVNVQVHTQITVEKKNRFTVDKKKKKKTQQCITFQKFTYRSISHRCVGETAPETGLLK